MMLRPGGVILIDTDNAEGPETRLEAACMGLTRIRAVKRVAEKEAGREYHLRYGRLTPPVHLYTFTMRSLTSVLQQRGSEVAETFIPAWSDPTWFPLPGASLLVRAAVVLFSLMGYCG